MVCSSFFLDWSIPPCLEVPKYNKQLKLVSGSPWNWTSSLSLSLPGEAVKTSESHK